MEWQTAHILQLETPASRTPKTPRPTPLSGPDMTGPDRAGPHCRAMFSYLRSPHYIAGASGRRCVATLRHMANVMLVYLLEFHGPVVLESLRTVLESPGCF
ncbi:unnamed protein product [Gadus morhua 'NCC']